MSNASGFFNKPVRNWTKADAAIAKRLAEHVELTAALQAAGLPRDQASRIAFVEITRRRVIVTGTRGPVECEVTERR